MLVHTGMHRHASVIDRPLKASQQLFWESRLRFGGQRRASYQRMKSAIYVQAFI